MSGGLWTPGAAAPSLDDFVARLERQIEEYTSTHASEQTHVEVELADGERLVVESLSSSPGYGFLTLGVGGEQQIVPVGYIRRVSLGPADDEHKPGFALPSKE